MFIIIRKRVVAFDFLRTSLIRTKAFPDNLTYQDEKKVGSGRSRRHQLGLVMDQVWRADVMQPPAILECSRPWSSIQYLGCLHDIGVQLYFSYLGTGQNPVFLEQVPGCGPIFCLGLLRFFQYSVQPHWAFQKTLPISSTNLNGIHIHFEVIIALHDSSKLPIV